MKLKNPASELGLLRCGEERVASWRPWNSALTFTLLPFERQCAVFRGSGGECPQGTSFGKQQRRGARRCLAALGSAGQRPARRGAEKAGLPRPNMASVEARYRFALWLSPVLSGLPLGQKVRSVDWKQSAAQGFRTRCRRRPSDWRPG